MAKNVIIENTGSGRKFHHAVGHGDDIHRRYGLWIIGGATNRIRPGSFDRPFRTFDFYNLSHLIEGRGKCAFEGGGERALAPGDCVIVTPEVVHIYGGTDDVYVEDTLMFQGPVADMLRDSGVLRAGVYPLGALRRVREIAEAARDPSVSAQINANGALQQLLLDIYNLHRRRRTGGDALEELLAVVKRSPERWWTVAELAELADLSADQLRRDFLRHTGMLPKAYIEQFKMHRAAELLHGGASIGETAERLGYRDVYHFSRRFKVRFGVAPGRFRSQLAPDATAPEG